MILLTVKSNLSKKIAIVTGVIIVLFIGCFLTILSSKLNKESSPLSLNVHKKNEPSNYSIEKENGEKIMWSDNSSGNEYKVSYKKI
ncbi:hypothetical protein EXQ38_14140 [Clostridium botulinum]|nr:hypothetical protein [Clostridium botulinum]